MGGLECQQLAKHCQEVPLGTQQGSLDPATIRVRVWQIDDRVDMAYQDIFDQDKGRLEFLRLNMVRIVV